MMMQWMSVITETSISGESQQKCLSMEVFLILRFSISGCWFHLLVLYLLLAAVHVRHLRHNTHALVLNEVNTARSDLQKTNYTEFFQSKAVNKSDAKKKKKREFLLLKEVKVGYTSQPKDHLIPCIHKY